MFGVSELRSTISDAAVTIKVLVEVNFSLVVTGGARLVGSRACELPITVEVPRRHGAIGINPYCGIGAIDIFRTTHGPAAEGVVTNVLTVVGNADGLSA